jgi:hypothetical protein
MEQRFFTKLQIQTATMIPNRNNTSHLKLTGHLVLDNPRNSSLNPLEQSIHQYMASNHNSSSTTRLEKAGYPIQFTIIHFQKTLIIDFFRLNSSQDCVRRLLRSLLRTRTDRSTMLIQDIHITCRFKEKGCMRSTGFCDMVDLRSGC